MRALIQFPAEAASHAQASAAPALIAAWLAPLGVELGQLAVSHEEPAQVQQPAALAALHRRYAIRSADRVALRGADARWPLLRAQFRQRHRHADREVRVFLRGSGLFELPLPDGRLARLVLGAGDWIALPAGLPHAFDAGARPGFDALRLFGQPEGWVATPSADAATAPLPDLDRFEADWADRADCTGSRTEPACSAEALPA